MSKVDELIAKFKEFKEELNKNINMSYSPSPNEVGKAEAGKNPKIMTSQKPIRPQDVSDKGASAFAIETPKDNKTAVSSRHPMSKDGGGMDMVAMSEKCEIAKNGQWKLDKVDPDENVNIPHPQGKAKMAVGINKEESKKDGTNQRLANPPESAVHDGRGKVHMVKGEKVLLGTGTNDENTGPGRNSGHGAL